MNNVVTIDINEVEFSELVNQVLASGEARIVSTATNGLALVSPLLRPKRVTAEAHALFLKAAGAWKDLDAEAMKRRIRERRDAGTSPRRP